MEWDDHVSDFSDFPLELTKSEKSELLALNVYSEIIRDRCRGVAAGYYPGFYLWGSGGIGKSYIVQDEFKRLDQPFRLSNTRLTAKGLFRLLAQYPNSIHLIEDAESLVNSKGESAQHAAGILRSALWAQPDEPRIIKWITDKENLEIDFGGSLILINNAPLDETPVLAAAKTRIAHFGFFPTNPRSPHLPSPLLSEVTTTSIDHCTRSNVWRSTSTSRRCATRLVATTIFE